MFFSQKGVMEILFEIFQLKEPDWTDDFQQALVSVGKAHKTLLIFLNWSNSLFRCTIGFVQHKHHPLGPAAVNICYGRYLPYR